MFRRCLILATALTVTAVTVSAEGDRPRLVRHDGPGGTQHGVPLDAGKALGDTIYLLGNPSNPDHVSDGGVGPLHNGSFEDQFGNPGWFGWTSVDHTYSGESHWHVSTFQAISGQYSMWCGTEYDGDPGYGNGWNQSLVFKHQIEDNTLASTVRLVLTLQNDTEPGYDYTYLEYNLGGVWTAWNPGGYDGIQLVVFDDAVTFQPGDFTGTGADEIQLRVRFSSDGAWSDEDGLWDTDGACQLDDVSVFVDDALVGSEDFEDGPDGTYAWVQVLDPGVGDFAALYVGLDDVDYCRSNHSVQAAFIDNGIVVPGTGGSPCITWCYGPGGYIVNNTGGLMGPDFHIDNHIISPPLEWPAGAIGAEVRFSVYRHEQLGAFNVWPGMFYQWHVRSVDTGDPADLEDTPWRNRSFVQYGGPDYLYQREVVTDLMEPDRTHAQVQLGVVEFGYVWGWVGTDGTPQPYFDNVAFLAYPFAGPGIAGRSIDWFNDSFPALGDLDLVNLENNAVRLDAAQNVAQQDDLVNYPGDSIWFDISAVRSGSVLADMPTMHVKMKANPLFDGVRVLPPNFTQTGDIIEGWVYGDSTFNANDNLVEDRYNFDLPDDDFFFPGDVLRYYIRAEDSLGGVTHLPGDTSGFADPVPTLRYPTDFEVRALPTLFSTTPSDQPAILFWQDAIDRGGQDEWFHAFRHLGLVQGVDFDLYATNGPSSGVGNGLGGRATSALLDGYRTLVYTSGTLSVNLLANGDFENDPSRDLQVVTSWFGRGDKNAFMTGDQLVSGLTDAGSLGWAFVNTYLGVNPVDNAILNRIGGQTAPVVAAIDGNGILARVDRWVAFGGCPRVNFFNAIEAVGTTVRLAEYTDPGGEPGAYPYAAATYHHHETENAEVVLIPHDFMFIYNAPGWTPPAGYQGIAARAILLEDVLLTFGALSGVPIAVAPDAPLAVRHYPNPFNPTTTIALDLPRAGTVRLQVYDLRGRLVRTLLDEHRPAGHHEVVWNGRDDAGRALSSGVYFGELRAAGETRVLKLALVK
jgi:hypothetical protein